MESVLPTARGNSVYSISKEFGAASNGIPDSDAAITGRRHLLRQVRAESPDATPPFQFAPSSQICAPLPPFTATLCFLLRRGGLADSKPASILIYFALVFRRLGPTALPFRARASCVLVDPRFSRAPRHRPRNPVQTYLAVGVPVYRDCASAAEGEPDEATFPGLFSRAGSQVPHGDTS